MKTIEIKGRYPNQSVKIDGVVQNDIVYVKYSASATEMATLEIKRMIKSDDFKIKIEHDAKELENVDNTQIKKI